MGKEINTNSYESVKREQTDNFKVSCTASVILGLAAHGFSYFNATYFHDRSTMVFPIIFDSAVRAKWMAQFTNLLTAYAYLPWLFGILVIIFFSLSVYMIVDTLEIQSKLSIWLIAGLCITHSAVINAHLYWPAEILIALPFAAASAWVWKKEKLHIAIRISAGAIFAGLSLASYGAYTSVAPCVVILSILFALIDGQDWWKSFRRGIEYVVTFLLGMLFYYVVLRLFLHFQDLSLLTYKDENRLVEDFPGLSEILSLIKQAWYSTLVSLNGNVWVRIMLVLAIALLIVQLVCQRGKGIQTLSYLLMLVLVGVFPLSAGLIYVMSFGGVHSLMTFADVMPLVAIVTLLDREWNILSLQKESWEKKDLIPTGLLATAFLIISAFILNNISGRLRVVFFAIIVCAVLNVVFLWFWIHLRHSALENARGNFLETVYGQITVFIWIAVLTIIFCVKIYQGILSANEAYAQADKMDTVNKSVVTRIVSRVEACEGFEGNEMLVLVGNIAENDYVHASDLTGRSTWEMWGKDVQRNGNKNGLTYNGVLATLLWTDAGWSRGLSYYTTDFYTPEEQGVIEEMPNYPADGSVKKIGDTIVVKFSDPADFQWINN